MAQKSVEEIAREEGISCYSYHAELMKAVRRSDREHWLEVAFSTVVRYARDHDEEAYMHALLRAAFTAQDSVQEKK